MIMLVAPSAGTALNLLWALLTLKQKELILNQFVLQSLTVFQRSLTTMQMRIQGLLQFAVPLFPTAEVSVYDSKCII